VELHIKKNRNYDHACELSLKCYKRIRELGYSAQWKKGCKLNNEQYIHRYKELKYYFFSTLYLGTESRKHSLMFTDFVGMLAAGLAMLVSLLIMWVTELNLGKFSVQVFLILVFGYVLKDRIKEWGKRYIIPLLKVPYRITDLKVLHGKGQSSKASIVGRVEEWLSANQVQKSQYDLYKAQTSSTLNTDMEISADDIGQFVQLLEPRSETELKYCRHVKLYEKDWKKRANLSFFRGVQLSSHYKRDLKLVQATRINLGGTFCSRMNSLRTERKVVDPLLKTPITLTCAENYTVRLKVKIEFMFHGKSLLARLSQRLLRLQAQRRRDFDEEVAKETEVEFLVKMNKEGIQQIVKM